MDWPALIAELTSSGLTQAQIVERCGCGSQAAISDLARGATTNPRYDLGKALERLVVEVRQQRADEAQANDDPWGPMPTTETVLDLTNERHRRDRPPRIGWPVSEADLDAHIAAKREDALADSLAAGMQPVAEG